MSNKAKQKLPKIIFLATTTPEKLAHYNAIASHLNLPIVFFSINQISRTFPSAPEDTGDHIENALQKKDKIKTIIELARQEGSEIRKNIEAFLAKGHL